MGGTLQAGVGRPCRERTMAQTRWGRPLLPRGATELAARIRSKQVSAREVMAAHLAQIERVNPEVNAIVTLVAERAMADAARADELLARGGPLGAAPRAAGRAQGSRGHGGDPHDARLALLSRPRADARCADRDAHSRRRRDHARQDQHAGVRRRLADVQHRVRRDAQSVRSRQDVRRKQRRRRRGARLRHGADRRRQRHRRLAAQPRGVLQRRRLPAVAGPRAERVGILVAALGVGSDGALGRRRRAVPQRDRRTRSARARSRFTRTARASARRSAAASRACASPGGAGSAASRSSRRSAASSTRTGGCSRISAASSKRPSRTSPASTRRFRSCATPPTTRSTRRWSREKPEWVKDTIKFEVAAGRAAHRRGCRPRAGAAGADVRAEPAVLRAVRLLRPAGHAGRAVRRDDAVSDADRRHADGDLHRLDALVLVRHVHGQSGDLGARRVHAERTAGRRADRRSSSRRLERAAARARVRAGDPAREDASAAWCTATPAR